MKKKNLRRSLSLLLAVIMAVCVLPTTVLATSHNGSQLGLVEQTELMNPENPADPGDPENSPENPADPEDPENSPENPADPGDPENSPENPADPEDPENSPENPADPEDPENSPENPADSEDPENSPENPADPEDPENSPENPADPEDLEGFSENPAEPEEPMHQVVRGVSPIGTTIDAFDYWITDVNENDGSSDGGIILSNPDGIGQYALSGINGYGLLKFSTEGPLGDNINVWTGADGHIWHDMVQPRLVNGYPVLRAGQPTGFDDTNPALPDTTSGEESLAYLFNREEITGAKSVRTDLHGLLRVDDEGYFYFDSAKTAAGLNDDGSFTLVDLFEGNKGIGFFPFNTASVYGKGYQTDTDDGYPDTARSHALNHFFGVRMTTQFLQSPDGKTDEGLPVTYEFSGDDDVWIFLDGVLVGDVGGNHNTVGVKVDFSTGEISYRVTLGWDDNPFVDDPESNSTIFKQFQKAMGEDGDIEYRVADAYGRPGEPTANEDEAAFADLTLGNIIYTFKKSGNNWIFADDSYHTLDFFYLERGGHESNMRLQFNFEEIPPSYIKKVDQDGKPLSGVGLELYVLPKEEGGHSPEAQDSHDISSGGLMVAEGTTDSDGRILLKYSAEMGPQEGKLLSLADLYNTYKDELVDEVVSSGGNTYKDVLMMELRETQTPNGYRSAERIRLRLENINGTYILSSNDRWNNGTYAIPSVVVSSGKMITLYRREDDGGVIRVDLSQIGEDRIGMFAVVLGWIGEDSPTADTIQELSNWGLVQGSAASGWAIKELNGAEEDYIKALGTAVGEYVRDNGSVEGCAYRFEPTISGSYDAAIDYLPGEITDYYFMLADSQGNIDPDKIGDVKFTTAFYYSEADSWEVVDDSQTYRLDHRASKFERNFATTISVSNIQNRLIVQRLDAVGNTVEGAEFGLYNEDAAETDADGRLTIKDGATPLKTEITKDLEKDPENGIHITAGGAAAFHGLEPRVYYVAEITPPPGYEKNSEVVKVIVDESGVHAYAGDPMVGEGSIDQNKGIAYGDKDGISVLVGVGGLVNTMAAFGSIGDIDTTLTDIYVLRARARYADGSDLGRNVDAAELRANWVEIASQNFDKLQRKWYVYDSDAALQYKYHTGTDTLGQDNLMQEDENPSGYLSSSGWNWNLISQNYFGVYDQGKSYRELYDSLSPDEQDLIIQEIKTKTPLPIVDEGLTHIFDGYTSYGNKVLNPLFSGSTMIRVASGAYGSLSIAKRVEAGADGETPDVDRLFPFTVSFVYAPPVLEEGRNPQSVGDIDYLTPKVAGTYAYEITNGSEVIENGTLTISEDGAVTEVFQTVDGAEMVSNHFSNQKILLKDGETLTIEGLPVGSSYTVQEEYDEHYQTSWVKTVDDNEIGSGMSYRAEGRIEKAAQADKVTFTNIHTEIPVPRPETGDLTVIKTVSGDGASTNQAFRFTVTLSDTSISGEYGDMVFRDGVAEFEIKANEHKTASGLPAGTEYTVTESDSGGYTLTDKSGDTGTIPIKETAEARFNNHKDDGSAPGGDSVTVTVKKVWKLDDGGKALDFVTVILMRDGELYGEAEVLNAENRWTYTWLGLEADHTWEVKELNVPDGFTQSVVREGNTFIITNDDDSTLTDNPDNPKPPQTGQAWWPVWILIAAGILLIAVGIWKNGALESMKDK